MPTHLIRQLVAFAALGLGISLASAQEASSQEALEVIPLPESEPPEVTPDAIPLDAIIVTGSRIPRAGFETLQAATVLDADTLSRRGGISIADALSEQPGFVAPTISGTDTSEGTTGGDDVGQVYVDYLGLGQQRTLTLVNGQRFPAGISPFTTGGLSVDLNLIPEALIDRVETIAVGGAPIYGSDAVAGTVNVILKNDFEGFEAFAIAGNSPQYQDFGRERLGATWGRAVGAGHLALSVQHSRTNSLLATDRPETSRTTVFESPADPDSPFALELVNDFVFGVISSNPAPLYYGDAFALNTFGNGIPLNINDPNSPLSQFGPDGELLPFVLGEPTGSVFAYDGGDGLRLSDYITLNQDIERTNVTALGHWPLSEQVELNAEAWLARTDALRPLRQLGYQTPIFGGLPDNNYGDVGFGPIPILIDNPFLPEATRLAIGAALDVVHDDNGDGQADPTIDTDGDGEPDAVGFWREGSIDRVLRQPPIDLVRRDLQRLVLGLRGRFDFADRPFDWDAGATWGRIESANRYLDILLAPYNQALLVTTDANGQPACVDPANGCAPLNMIGTPTREAIDFVTRSVTDVSTTEQSVLSANIAGHLMTLPAGPLAVAGGVSWRREEARFAPNPFAATGQTFVPLTPISGAFDSREVYLETKLPLLAAAPWAEQLIFEGALRFVDNSVADTDTTWTAGLRYQPIPGLELRGNRTQSIRAPSITELFTPESTIVYFAVDPCDARFVDQGDNPDRRLANCTADGVEQPFQSIAVNAGQFGTLSGNTELRSEQARSSSVGLVWQPNFLPGFALSSDWFDIRIGDAIETLTATDLLNACYDSASFPNEAACDRFARGDDGQLVEMNTGFINIGLSAFRGQQSALDYSFGLPLGRMRLGLTHLYTRQLDETPGNSNTVRRAGTIGRSKNRVTAQTTWSVGNWEWFNQLRWTQGAVFDNADGPNTRNIRGVSAFTVWDTSLRYHLPQGGWQIQIGLDNVLDEDPPFASSAFPSALPTYFSGVQGRYATLSLRYER